MLTLELIHLGGERRTVQVVGHDNATVWFVWPMAGIWKIRVMKNVIVGMRGRWRAVDHETLKELHRGMLEAQGAEFIKRRHG